MRSRLHSILTGLSLSLLLLGCSSKPVTLVDMAYREKLEGQPLVMSTYGYVRPVGEKYEYLHVIRGKNNRWGVISEQRLQEPHTNRYYVAPAKWLAQPVYEAVVLPDFKRTQGHIWVKPEGATQWQVFRTDGKKLTAPGATPYSDIRLLRVGKSNGKRPHEDIRPFQRDLVMGIRAGDNPASATVDLIDVGNNQVLLTLTHLDTREEPRLENGKIVFRHDSAANGYTIVRLPAPPAPTENYALLDASDFYLNLVLDAPAASGTDLEGKVVILDKDLRPFPFPGLTLGQPLPLHPAWSGPDHFYKVQVSTDKGRAGYQFIYRDKDGNPALAPTLWQDILQMQGYVIVVNNGQWQMMTAIRRKDGYDFQPRLFNGQPVTATSLEALYAVVAGVKQADVKQAAIDIRLLAEQQAKWQAEYAEQRRKEAAEKAELQRRIDANAKARIAADAEYQRQKAESAAKFAERNKSSWISGQPITLPSLQGAPGLSTLEKDYYDNRGNARNPYVIREKPKQ